VAYLDDVRRTLGEAAVQREWRRVWRGYASLAYFVEHALLRQIAAQPPPAAEAQPAGPAEPADAVDLIL
jgi:hypothetical protein